MVKRSPNFSVELLDEVHRKEGAEQKRKGKLTLHKSPSKIRIEGAPILQSCLKDSKMTRLN